MEINSFAVRVKDKLSDINLFVGVGGLDTNLQKAIKRKSTRFSQKRDALLWNAANISKDVDEAYFPVWEEELEASLMDAKSTLKEFIIGGLNTQDI